MKTLKIIKKVIFALFVLKKLSLKKCKKIIYIIIYQIMYRQLFLFFQTCFFLKQTM